MARNQELSKRESQVVDLISQGMVSGEIGAKLHISSTTVDRHVKMAMTKINARNRAEAVAIVERTMRFTRVRYLDLSIVKSDGTGVICRPVSVSAGKSVESFDGEPGVAIVMEEDEAYELFRELGRIFVKRLKTK